MIVDRNGTQIKVGDRVRWFYLEGTVTMGETRPRRAMVRLDRTGEEQMIYVSELEVINPGSERAVYKQLA